MWPVRWRVKIKRYDWPKDTMEFKVITKHQSNHWPGLQLLHFILFIVHIAIVLCWNVAVLSCCFPQQASCLVLNIAHVCRIPASCRCCITHQLSGADLLSAGKLPEPSHLEIGVFWGKSKSLSCSLSGSLALLLQMVTQWHSLMVFQSSGRFDQSEMTGRL